MIYKLERLGNAVPPSTVNLRCPHWRHAGAFHGIPSCPDVQWTMHRPMEGDAQGYSGGARQCPNENCRALPSVRFTGS